MNAGSSRSSHDEVRIDVDPAAPDRHELFSLISAAYDYTADSSGACSAGHRWTGCTSASSPWRPPCKVPASDDRSSNVARRLAEEGGLDGLELETRIELTENHHTFGRLGFVKTAESSHPGYTTITSITMRAPLRRRWRPPSVRVAR